MKNIKLITGLSALSALTIGTLPLTSCNKNSFDGKVTEAEWKDALDYASNPETNWCFGQEDDYFAGGFYVSETSYAITSYNQWINNEQGNYINGLVYLPSEETRTEEVFEKRLDGLFSYAKNIRIIQGQKDNYYHITPGQIWLLWSIMFNSMYDYQSSFTFDNDGYYNFAGVLGELITTNTKVKFGSDKKIQHFVMSASYPTGEAGSQLFAANAHFNYSKQDIKFDNDFLERINKHSFKMNNTESINFDSTIYKDQSEGLFFSIVPPENKTYKTISCYDQDTLVKIFGRSIDITKNNIELVKDTDYKINDNGTITITDGFTNKDLLCINIHPIYTDKQYTLKIS